MRSSGICVLGDVTFGEEDVTVNACVRDVVVSGFEVRDFADTGIVTLGAQNARIQLNRTFDNELYGIFDIASVGTRILGNVVSGSEDAGIYVGDSPNAKALVAGNAVRDNALGIFVRNAMHGTIRGNVVQNNCVGMLVLGDAPGPAASSASSATRSGTTRARARRPRKRRPSRGSASRSSELSATS